jgi:exodeoxyribonuclease VII large subunit
LSARGGLQRSVGAASGPGASAENAVTVSSVTEALRNLVESALLPLWIKGEIGDFKQHRNGHWYFSLRDGASQLRCVVWSKDQRAIPAPPDDGMQVTVFGQLTVYTARGDVQLSVKRMESKGDGLWRKALERTRASLEADGLLAPERKRPLPRMPRCVAVITSPDGAALHDVVHVVRRRAPSVSIVIVPARVQGEGAERDLLRAMRMVTRWRDADVLIIGRGGGSRDDLWCFNDEKLARAIAASPIPTISAVGHEVDTTICDLVADYRAATPSAAAEAAVPASADLGARLRAVAQRVRRAMITGMRTRRSRMALVYRALPASLERQIVRRDGALRVLAARINGLSPLSALARGYTVAQSDDGGTLARADDFHPGQHFRLTLLDGSVAATADAVSRRPAQ